MNPSRYECNCGTTLIDLFSFLCGNSVSVLQVCVSVCSLFIIHGHSFERIYAKFRRWHPYTLSMVTGVSERHSNPGDRAPRAR